MRFFVMSVFDVKAGAYLPPFFVPTLGMGQRAIIDAFRDPTHQFSKNPLDYSLYHLASFDDATGLFELLPGPRLVIDGSAILSIIAGVPAQAAQ